MIGARPRGASADRRVIENSAPYSDTMPDPPTSCSQLGDTA